MTRGITLYEKEGKSFFNQYNGTFIIWLRKKEQLFYQ